MAIPDLPSEVLICIFEHARHLVSHHIDHPRFGLRPVPLIKQIARCSRRFRDLASAVFYRTVSFDQSGEFVPSSFLRLLAGRPRIGRDHVKHLVERGHRFARVTYRMADYDERDFAKCKAAIEEVTADSGDWLRQLRLGSRHHVIGLILPQLTALESICISYDVLLSMTLPLYQTTEGAIRLIPRVLRRLESLKRVCLVDLWHQTQATWLDGSFDRDIRRTDWSLIDITLLELQLPTVRQLRLLNCSLDIENLARILSCFPNISSLDVELNLAAWDRSSRSWQEGFDFAMRPLEGTLTTLSAFVVTKDHDEQGNRIQDQTISTFTLWSLERFEKLTSLTANICTLMNSSYDCRLTSPRVKVSYVDDDVQLYARLPRSLQRLELRNCNIKVLRQLKVLRKYQRECLPALKRIHVESCCANMIVRRDRRQIYHDWWDSEMAMVDDLIEEFRVRGVELTFEHRNRRADISLGIQQAID